MLLKLICIAKNPNHCLGELVEHNKSPATWYSVSYTEVSLPFSRASLGLSCLSSAQRSAEHQFHLPVCTGRQPAGSDTLMNL